MSSFGPLLWFAVIVALIPLSLWLVKRSPLGAQLGATLGARATMRVVGALPLGPGQRIVTVEVGEGESRTWLVLGATAQSITALHALPPPAGSEPPVGPAQPSFGALLSSLASRGQPRPTDRP